MVFKVRGRNSYNSTARPNYRHSFKLISLLIDVPTRLAKNKIYKPVETECAITYDEWVDYQKKL